jgi:hypothetical protein
MPLLQALIRTATSWKKWRMEVKDSNFFHNTAVGAFHETLLPRSLLQPFACKSMQRKSWSFSKHTKFIYIYIYTYVYRCLLPPEDGLKQRISARTFLPCCYCLVYVIHGGVDCICFIWRFYNFWLIYSHSNKRIRKTASSQPIRDMVVSAVPYSLSCKSIVPPLSVLLWTARCCVSA